MSTPKLNATSKEMAALTKLNKSLYGTKPDMGVPTSDETGLSISKPLKKQSFASYKMAENKAAKAAGQDRPDRATLLQQYKSMNAAPVKDRPVPAGMGESSAGGGPRGGLSPYNTDAGGGPRGGLSPYNTDPVRPAGSDMGGGMGGGTPAGTLSPRGAVTGGARPAPTRPMSTGPTLSPRGAMTGGARPAPSMGGGMFKKGGSVRAEKMASGGMTSKAPTASKRGDGIAQRGKTKGRMV